MKKKLNKIMINNSTNINRQTTTFHLALLNTRKK